MHRRSPTLRLLLTLALLSCARPALAELVPPPQPLIIVPAWATPKYESPAIFYRWWFWTTVAAVAATGLAIGLFATSYLPQSGCDDCLSPYDIKYDLTKR